MKLPAIRLFDSAVLPSTTTPAIVLPQMMLLLYSPMKDDGAPRIEMPLTLASAVEPVRSVPIKLLATMC